jgi:hypothetical protein
LLFQHILTALQDSHFLLRFELLLRFAFLGPAAGLRGFDDERTRAQLGMGGPPLP